MHIRILVIASATAAMLGSAKAEQAADDHLGTVHFPISCSAVQAKFDRSVALLHNFFYPETVKAFQAVIQEDPSCAMAYKDYDKIDHKTRARFYEQAMQLLHEHYPEDSEAAIFYALALNGAVDFDDRNYAKQLKAAAILNEEAKKQPSHPGIAHYLIHSYDFAPLAAMCVPTAQLYDKIAPAAPHALHMPSHIYSMLGMWDGSVRSNLAAKASADDYAAQNYPDGTHPSIPHLLDFPVTAYLQTAKDGDAK